MASAQAGELHVGSPAEFRAVSNFFVVFRPELLDGATILPGRANATNALAEGNVIVQLATKSGRKVKFTLAPESADVLYFSALEGFSGRASSGTNGLKSMELEGLAARILAKTGLATNFLKKVRAKTVVISTHSKYPLFEVLWQRHEGGFDFKQDFVRLVLDPRDGELLAYRKNWGQTPDSFAVNVSKDEAHRTACSVALDHFRAKHAPKANVRGPVVVCPNRTFSASPMSADTRRLAWVVEIPKQTDYKNAVEVWIDAENGRIVGGEMLW